MTALFVLYLSEYSFAECAYQSSTTLKKVSSYF